MDYHYLLDLAIILLTTKIFGLVSRRLHMPQVVGALIAGIVFGPLLLNVLTQTVFIKQLAELGVIMIMFTAGLSTNIKELRQTGKAGFVVAMVGVIVPLVGGTAVGFIFNHDSAKALMENIFLGTVLTATSVSITVETLKEMGKLNTKVGSTILAAALIDDVLGLVCLTIVSSFAGDASVNVGIVLLKILAFFVLAIGFGFLAIKGLNWYAVKLGRSNLQRFHLFAFIICLLMAFAAEHFFGVADIIGAFAAGLIIGNTLGAPYMEARFNPLSYLLLTPVFFASLGLSIQRTTMNLQLILFTVVLLAMAVVSKLIGCGLGAKLCGMTKRESIQVGFGMVCRGEVALIVANKGMAAGVVPPEFFGPIIVLVVFCSVVTPILLKITFRGDTPALPDVQE
ncbi:MAG: cation:proton antiporter [Oscillospiraceae bacterium]|jgi:Kef-type K+ transport system membrane component KefB|nr:cation:proton antiporter [Oscillospiraceae bacterium]